MRSRLVCLPLIACLTAASQLAEPRPFGPDLPADVEVFRGSFAPDGAFYFFRSLPGRNRYRIVVSRPNGSGWTAPEPVLLGGDFSDSYPSVSTDGRRLVFASWRPIPGGGPEDAHLWYADRTADGWAAPVFMDKATAPGSYHSWVHVAEDGAVYFRRTTTGDKTQTLVTRWNGDGYGIAQPVVEVERWRTWRADVDVVGGLPGPHGDSLFLDVATRDPATGRRASDIWVAVRERGGWLEPRPLGLGINSPGYDVFPFFSRDGHTLYFVRDFRTFHAIDLQRALDSATARQP